MKIGIIQTGRALDEIIARHGDFDDLFMQLLSKQGFEFKTYAVLDDIFPDTVSECDGWLITGSRHSSYEDLPWIPRLEGFLRDVFAASIPIVGICFGHQVLAQALGGKVEKYSGGWGIGPHKYHFDGIEKPVVVNAWHQDQVTELPKGATSVGRSEFCTNAAIAYDSRAFTIQAHPEFSNDFMADLIDMRRGSVPTDLVAVAEDKLKSFSPSPEVVMQIVSFFRTRSLAIVSSKQTGAG